MKKTMNDIELTTGSSMDLTVKDVNELIDEITTLRLALEFNNLTDKQREDCRYLLALYIVELKNKRVRV